MDLIGITGTHGAGKGTITRYLVQEHGFAYVSVSEFLAKEAARRGMKADRHARHDIANEYRARAPTALMEAVCASIDPDAERVIVEPQYTLAEARFIKEQGGTMLAVDASAATRYERVHVRGSLKDDVSFEEFTSAEEAEMRSDNPEAHNLAATMAAADIRLMNDGTEAELEASVAAALHEQGVI